MRKKQGFTLIELLISVSIIAILSVIASISYSKAQKNGRDIRRKEDLRLVQNAAEQYYLLNSSNYPTNTGVAWTGPGDQLILQDFPTGPKGESYNSTLTDSSYCICGGVENDTGNSNDVSCSDLSQTDGSWFCVRNQQ